MTVHPHQPGIGRTRERIRASLRDDRSPRNIRSALPAEDLEAFDRQYREALQKAADELDLTPLHECVESWWRYVVLKTDNAEYTRMLERAEEAQSRLERGEPTGGIPWDDAFEARLRGKIGGGR